WHADKALDYLHPDALNTLISQQFAAVKPTDVACTTVLDASLWAQVQALMVKRFVEIASSGWQFERFEAAWRRWLDINAGFDWTEEHLLERVQAMLETNLLTASVQATALCECAKSILNRYGAKFHERMDDNLRAGLALEYFRFTPPAIDLCAGMSFKAGTSEAIAALLKERYGAYTEVSYRLQIVVNLLSKLSNAYPGATLHDCDDGSDHNPVRLDNTALGNYPLRTSIT